VGEDEERQESSERMVGGDEWCEWLAAWSRCAAGRRLARNFYDPHASEHKRPPCTTSGCDSRAITTSLAPTYQCAR
jgi:hypothetical protein